MNMSEPPMTRLRGVLREDEPMSRHVSWRAGGAARVFYQPADVLDLAAFLSTRDAHEPVLFVGLGSNLLVRDGDVVVTMGAGSIANLAPELTIPTVGREARGAS